MPKPGRAPELDVFVVSMASPSALTGVREVSIRASYFQYDDGFIIFKEDGGDIVHALRKDLVSEVKRLRTRLVYAVPADDIHLAMDALLGYEARDSTTEARIRALMHMLAEQHAENTATERPLVGSKNC